MSDERVLRNDVVKSLTDLQSDILGTANEKQRSLMGSVVALAGLLLVAAYGLGRRAGRRRSGFIEIRR